MQLDFNLNKKIYQLKRKMAFLTLSTNLSMNYQII